MPWRQRPDTFQRFMASMPRRSRVALFLTVFCLFGSFGFIHDIMSGGRHTAARIVVDAVFSGTWAALFIAFIIRTTRPRWMMVLVWTAAGTALSLLVTRWFATMPLATAADLTTRLNVDGAATMAAVIGGYVAFATLLRHEGGRFLRMRTEMDLARDIHRSLAPDLRGDTRGFSYEGAAYPSGDVGGDLIDVVTGAGADQSVAYIADVSGHGVQSGVVMAMVKSAARMAVRHDRSIEAAFDELGAVLRPLMRPNMFVTAAAVASTDAGFRILVAGHLPILHYHAGSRTVTEETVANLPLGFFADRPYVAQALACAEGDLLALITDGLVEVFDAADHELGLGAVKRVIAETGHLPLDRVLRAIRDSALTYGAQVDDQSALLLRIRQPRPA